MIRVTAILRKVVMVLFLFSIKDRSLILLRALYSVIANSNFPRATFGLSDRRINDAGNRYSLLRGLLSINFG